MVFVLREKWHLIVLLVLAAAALIVCYRNRGKSPGEGLAPSLASSSGGSGSVGGLVRSRPHHGRERDGLLIEDRLAPGLEIEKGEVDRNVIKGPVKVTGTLPPSTMNPLPAADGVAEETFKIEASDSGLLVGDFVIESAGALATRTGVRFTGPLLLKYQGDVGQWYQLGSDSDEAYFFVSTDGSTKLLIIPAGTQSVPEGPPEPDVP